MIQAVIMWMGSRFSPEQYIFWTRIQCTAWTLADILIVYYLLRIGDLARSFLKVERHKVCYVIWLATLPLSATIPFLTRGYYIFAVELLVTLPHFLIILYALAADGRYFFLTLSFLVRSTNSAK
jgi:hypothetical protein